MNFDLSALQVKRAVPLEIGMPEELTQTDLALLAKERPSAREGLKRLTDRHHAVARLLALGTRPGAVAIITGYTPSTITLLQTDPTFQELLSFYRLGEEDEYRKMRQQLAGLGDDALQELRRRVEDEPEKLTFKQLMDTVVLVADRTGNGPSSTSVNVDIKVGLADRLRAARDKSASMREIEAVARDITAPAEAAE